MDSVSNQESILRKKFGLKKSKFVLNLDCIVMILTEVIHRQGFSFIGLRPDLRKDQNIFWIQFCQNMRLNLSFEVVFLLQYML